MLLAFGITEGILKNSHIYNCRDWTQGVPWKPGGNVRRCSGAENKHSE